MHAVTAPPTWLALSVLIGCAALLAVGFNVLARRTRTHGGKRAITVLTAAGCAVLLPAAGHATAILTS